MLNQIGGNSQQWVPLPQQNQPSSEAPKKSVQQSEKIGSKKVTSSARQNVPDITALLRKNVSLPVNTPDSHAYIRSMNRVNREANLNFRQKIEVPDGMDKTLYVLEQLETAVYNSDVPKKAVLN